MQIYGGRSPTKPGGAPASGGDGGGAGGFLGSGGGEWVGMNPSPPRPTSLGPETADPMRTV